MKQVHVWVSGDVQGVGYRSFVKERASEFGIAGWVKNLPDGRVEAVFEGTPVGIAQMLTACRQGPPGSTVEGVEEREESEEGMRGFVIKY